MVDEWTRECLAIDVAGSIRSVRVIDVLSRLISQHGAPRTCAPTTAPSSSPQRILTWLGKAGIDTAFIDPGKPWQNGLNESFNDKFRNECLSLEWFRNRTEARAVIEAWRWHDNDVRPHSSLGDLTPTEFRRKERSETPKSGGASFKSELGL
jgi:putative transposase